MDAMSDAIEGADVMLYGVSLRYKESANVRAQPTCCLHHHAFTLRLTLSACVVPFQCRLEANYGHQQELDMIPLMMQKDYSAKGWLGLILGTRLWYAIHSALSFDCCESPLFDCLSLD